MEKKNKKKNGRKFVTLLLAVAASAAVLVGTYLIISRILMTQSIETIEEIAVHDEQAIYNEIENEWADLDKTLYEVKMMRPGDEKELLDHLSVLSLSEPDCMTYLLSSEGTLYSGTGIITQEDALISFIQSHNGRFVDRYDRADSMFIEHRTEALMIGIELQDFQIGNNRFSYIVKRIPIQSLDDKLKIDSFGGRGRASVVDKDGVYIVNLNRSRSLLDRDSLNLLLERSDDSEYYYFDAIRDTLKSPEDSVTFTVKVENAYVLFFVKPLKDTGWYYMSQVPVSVFRAQSLRILMLFSAMVVVILLLIALVYYASFHAELQKKQNEATHRKELAEALAMAQQANRAKTTFLSNMSHDIRTPMNAIIGFTGLASTHIDNKEAVKDYLCKIGQASNHLLSLINDVLDMSRIESGKVVIEEKEEDLAEILRSLQNILMADVQAKNLELHIDTMNIQNERIICDKLRLNQILLNLMSNAVKYTPSGGLISLQVSQLSASKNDRAVFELRVKDNGIGMSQEFTKTIFEPFTREKSTTVSGIQGTGLGMAITKNIVDMMGGTITCTSKLGVGSEFIVTLPFRTDVSPAAPKKVPETNTDSFLGKRILLTEDNKLNQEIAATILEDAGFAVEIAGDGQTACNMLLSKDPDYYDLVLMDIQLPDMDGYEVTRIIRSCDNKKLAEIPIFAMTANAFEEDRKKAFDSGMNGHIAKPVSVPVLMEELRKLFDKREDKNA